MNDRRRFLEKIALAGAVFSQLADARGSAAEPDRAGDERAEWVAMLTRVAEPVLAGLAANQLKARMPVETAKGNEAGRRAVTHLEALGRTLGGIAPWLGVAGVAGEEEKSRARFAALAR